jgi:hypothetical protein
MPLVQLSVVRKSTGSGHAPKPPKNLAKFEVGPFVIEQRESGDLLIYTQELAVVTTRSAECDVAVRGKVASETNRIEIKSADVLDLVVALDKVLGNRHDR